MVEFCHHCGSSLPQGDITIRQGKAFTSPDYACPECRKIANPQAPSDGKAYPDPSAASDVVIRDGTMNIE